MGRRRPDGGVFMTFASRLAKGETLFTAWSGIPDPLTVEAMASLGVDAVTLDMQHGGHSEESVLRSVLPIAHARKHAIVRIPVGRWDMASRALDFGAEAVIAPMVNSVEDARRFAAHMKYPTMGERSWGPTFAVPRAGGADAQTWLKESNATTVSFAMIETRSAFAVLDGILETPGIDGIFVGPADFSIAWTDGATVDSTLEDMMETIAAIAARTKAAGKHAGIFVVNAAMSGRFVEMGYRLLALGTEHRYMRMGAETLLAAARKSMG